MLARGFAARAIGEVGPEPSNVSLNMAVFELPSVMPSNPNVVPLLLFVVDPGIVIAADCL